MLDGKTVAEESTMVTVRNYHSVSQNEKETEEAGEG